MIKRKDGRYQQSVTIAGKVHYFYGKTKAEVLRKINAYTETEKRGKLFSDVAGEWWAEHSVTLASNTLKGYQPAVDRAVLAFYDCPLKDVTPPQIMDYLRDFAKSHAEKTNQTQLLVINLIYKYAIQKGYCLYNPASALTAPQGLGKKKRTMPTQSDIEKIKSSVSVPFGLFAYMALYTGLRVGELLALEWSDISLKNRTISVTKSVYHINNRPFIKSPKTATSEGCVPILDVLLAVLPHKLPKSGQVFPDINGGLMRETCFAKLWKDYCTLVGISCTPHQLRHAFATMLFEANVPPEQMQVLLRHAQLSTTMDIYKELRENKREEIFKSVYNVNIG